MAVVAFVLDPIFFFWCVFISCFVWRKSSRYQSAAINPRAPKLSVWKNISRKGNRRRVVVVVHFFSSLRSSSANRRCRLTITAAPHRLYPQGQVVEVSFNKNEKERKTLIWFGYLWPRMLSACGLPTRRRWRHKLVSQLLGRIYRKINTIAKRKRER